MRRRREMHLHHLSPSREESHQARALSKGQVQRDHSREDLRNRVRALLDKGQNQGKDPLGRDPGKVRDHRVRGPNQARVPLAKDPLGRDPGKVRDHQARGPNQARVPLAKDPLGRPPGKVRDHQAKDHQARDPNQARVPLAKDPLGRPPGKVRDHQAKVPQGNRPPNQVKDHQVKAPNRVALPSKKVDPLNKDLGSLDPNSKDHQALGLILESQLRAEGLLVSRGLESLEVDSVHCVRPPS